MGPQLQFKEDQIRFLRESLGLSTQELASRVGVSKQAVSSWEAGHTRPTVDHLLRIVNMTGAKLESFFTAAEPPASKRSA